MNPADSAEPEMLREEHCMHLLLDLISTARPITVNSIAALTGQDWKFLQSMSKQHRLGPMAYERCKTLSLLETLPQDVREEWAGAYRRSAFRYLSFLKVLNRIAIILNDEDIPFAALKGAWLSQFAFTDPALRPLRDLDILVPPEKALRVYSILESNGFHRLDGYQMPLADAITSKKHLPGLRCADTNILVEVHTRIVDVVSDVHDAKTLYDVPGLLADRVLRGGASYLSPTAMLLHLIVHAVYDHQLNNGPLTFADVAVLMNSAEIDWPKFWTMAKAGDWERGCLLILELASYYHHANSWRDSCTATVFPTEDQIECAALLSLQDFEQRGVLGFKAEMASAKGLFGKAQILTRRAFPSRHALAEYAGIASTAWRPFLHYPGWFCAQIGRTLFQKSSRETTQDIRRAVQVRNWIY